jgi:hypothetical protein
MLLIHLRLGVLWNPSLHYESFHVTFMLIVEVEWLEPLVIGPILTMVVLCRMKLRPGRATRGKSRIPDGKGGE